MALQYLFDPNTQFQYRDGENNVSGFLRVYFNGTDDRATTYCNFDGGLNEPDIVLDTDGRAVVIVDDTKTYRLEVYNRFGGLMWTVTNYNARGGSGGGSGTPVSVEGTVGEIEVDENTEGGVKHFVVGLAATIKNAIATLTMAVNGVANALNGKKDRQVVKNFFGSATKTVTGLSQDANGEITPEFSDIDFDSKVLPFYPQGLGYMTPDERAALNAKMQEVAYNGGMIILWDGLGANYPCVMYGYSSDEYYFYRIEKYGNEIEYHQTIVTYDGVTKTFNVDQSSTTIDPTLYEKVANKKTTITGNESSTTYYPNIKAVVDYINGVMQNLGGKLITDNGAPFSDSTDLPSSTPYNGVAIQDKDYAYVQGTGTAERWSATVTGSSVSWANEYTINIPVFSVAQQAAIDSGITASILSDLQDGVASIPTKTSQLTNDSNFATTGALNNGLATKQNVIPNLSTIESGAAAGATAVQPETLNSYATTTALNNGLATKQDTISDLATIRTGAAAGATALQPTGNGSNVTATFSEAGTRSNIGSGESLSTIFGKIKKFFSDLKAVAFSGSYADLSGTPTIPEAATSTPQPVSSSDGSTGSSSYWAKGDHVHKIVVAEGVNNGQVSIAGQSVSVKGWGTKQDALPTSGTVSSTYAINISGTAANATNDGQGYNIYQNYMRTSSGTKSLSFGATTTIGTVNGSNVVLSMPQANFISKDLNLAPFFTLSTCQFICHESVPPAGTWNRYRGSDVCDAFETQIGFDWGISSTNYGGTADKATNDWLGNNIVSTYATKTELSDTATGLGSSLASAVTGIYDSMNRGCVRSAFDYKSIAGKFTDVFSVKRESTSYVDAVVRLKVWGKYQYISATTDHTFCADITVQIRGESGSSNWTSAIADGCILYKGTTSSVSDLRVKMTTDSDNRLYISILATNATEQYTRMIVESNFMTNNSERCSFSNLVTIYGAGPAGRSALGAEFSLT